MSGTYKKDYLKEIFSFLNDIEKNSNITLPNIECKENEINLSSQSLFKELYSNLILRLLKYLLWREGLSKVFG